MMKRIDVPTDVLDDRREGDTIELPDDPAHYVGNVLRMRPDDRFEMFDGTGRLAVARVERSRDEVVVELLEFRDAGHNESPLTIRLYQAIPKGKRWKWLLQKATELGVDEIVPLQTRHTVVKIPDDRLDKKHRRWSKIVSKATRQSRRTVIPTITDPLGLDDALEEADESLQVLLHNTDGRRPALSETLDEATDSVESIGLWVGPEGGFADDEIETLTDRGLRPVSVGPRVLRAETAGIVAISLTQARLGDI